MLVRHEAVQRRVDRGRARIEIEGAVVEQRHHLVLMGEAAIERVSGRELVEIEGREAVALHRAEIAAGALDPQHVDRLRRSADRSSVTLAEVLPPPKLVMRRSAPSRLER